MNKLKWSQAPGCFERHLQRRYANPLFPHGQRSVTLEDITAAQLKDLHDYNQLRDSFLTFVQKTSELPSIMSAIRVSSLRQEIERLIERATEIGLLAQEIRTVLVETRRDMLATLRQSVKAYPTALEALDKANRQYDSSWPLISNHFIAQLSRSDSPIINEDIVPSLLSEDLDTVKLATKYLSNDTISGIAKATHETVESVDSDTRKSYRLDEKLKLINEAL